MNRFKIFSSIASFCVLGLGQAFALPVTFNANSSYVTSPDSSYVMFIDKLDGNGNVVGKTQLNLHLNGQFQSGNLNSNVFDTFSLTSSLASASATNLDNNQALQVNLNGSLSFSYQNVNRSADGSAVAQIGSNAMQVLSTPTLTLNGTLDNQSFSTSVTLSSMAGTKDPTELSGYFAPLVNNFGVIDGSNDGKVTFSLGSWNHNNDYSALIGWHGAHNATALLNGQAFTYNLSSDIHGRLDTAAVPEPTTVGLLISGILGGAAKRRRKIKA